MRVQSFVLMGVACCATQVLAVELTGSVDSNLVFAAGETVEVAAGDAATVMGTFQLDGTANGTIYKTGGGTLTLATAVVNGKANGDSADGGKASLAVEDGTFRVSTPSAVKSTFSGNVTISDDGSIEMNSGTVFTPQLNLGGAGLRISGGTFTATKAAGTGIVDVVGGTLAVTGRNFKATGDMRINLSGDATLIAPCISANEGVDLSLHVDGGTIKPDQDQRTSNNSSYNDAIVGGTCYVGAGGMTIDTANYYAWGTGWNMPVRSEPGVTDGGITITSSKYAETRAHGLIRILTDDFDIAGPVRVNNAQVMLLGEHYTVPFVLDNRSDVRAAVSPVVEVDRLEFTGDSGNILVGVDQTTLVPTLLKVNDFTPPKRCLGVTWWRGTTTSVSAPTNAPMDFLKIPATVDLPLSRMTPMSFRSGFVPRITMRTEGGWKIYTLTVFSDAVAAADVIDPHTSDAWMDGTSPWCLTNCLYSYTGGTRAVAAKMLADPASAGRNAAISIPEDVTLTLTDGADQQRGGIVKMGEGTLALTGDVGYNFSRNFSGSTSITKSTSQANLGMFNENNICVRSHYGSLNVGAGTLTIGTGTDNPQVTVIDGQVNVGTSTVSDDGGEKDAALVMNSGSLSAINEALVIGLGHGIDATQAHSPLVSSFTLNGGYVDAWNVRVGHDLTERSQQDSRLVINGGEFLCRRWFSLGTNVVKGTKATLEVNGGTLDIGATAVAQGQDGGLYVGYPGNAKSTNVFTVAGGEVNLHGGAFFAAKSHHTVNLNGGTLTVKGGNFDASTSAGSSVLNWNGGVVKLGSGIYLQNFKTVNIGERGAILDISEGGALCYLKVPLTNGVLHVRGGGYQNGIQLYDGYQHCDGIVVERGGNVMLRETTPATCPVLVKDGGVITGYYTSSKPHTLTLGETENGVTTVLGYEYTGDTVTGYITVTDTLTINGKVYVGGRETSGGMLSLSAGSNITLLRAKAGELTKYGVEKFELHPDLVAHGCNATLSIVTSSGYDNLRVTVTAAQDPNRRRWIAGTSGQWSVAENWDYAPLAYGNTIAFPASLAEDITVSAGSTVRMRRFVQDSEKCVKIDAPVVLPTYCTYNIAKTNGVLELAGTASIGSPCDAKGQGTLRVTGKITTSPNITVVGRIEGPPESLGTAKLLLNNSTVRFTENGTFAGQILHTATNKNGVGVEVLGDKVAYATGALNNHSALQKTGPGTVVFCRTGQKASVTNVVGHSAKNATTYPYSNGLNGAVPNGAALGIYAGTVAFDGDTKTRYSVLTNETWIGQYPIPDGTGGAYDACLEVRGGELTLDGLVIGIHSKDASMAGSATDIGLTRSQKSIVNVKGGVLRIVDGGCFIMGYPRYTTSLISELNVSGGLLEVNGGTGVAGFGIGYHDSSNAVDAAELSSTINISGDGILRKVSSGSMKFGVYGANRQYSHQIFLNMTGGRLESPANNLDLLYANGGKATVDANVHVNLAGGVIDVNKITSTKTLGTSISTIDFLFNGGTYRPNAAESTFPEKEMTSFTVGEGGAKFDLIENNLLTLATQPLVTAEGVEHDGGITLDATGDAVLTLSVSNAFNGPIVVNGGKVVPTVPEAVNCATGVVVNGAGVFDANGLALTFGKLGGDGLYTNGTVTVTDAVEPTGTSLAVESLVLANGATLRCPASDASGSWSAPCLAAGSVSGQGTLWLDLGFAADAPPPHGTRVLIAKVPSGVGFPAIRFRNPGWTKATVSLSRVTNGDYTEIWAEVVPRAMVLILR